MLFKNVTNWCLISWEIFFTQWNIHHRPLIIVSAGFLKIMAPKDSILPAYFKDTCRNVVRVYRDCLSCCHRVLWKSLFFAVDAINGYHMKLAPEKNPLSPFITLNHFLQISQDHIYWKHLSFPCWGCRQRRIASPARFKDSPSPTEHGWQSLILLNSNHCSVSSTHFSNLCSHAAMHTNTLQGSGSILIQTHISVLY